MATITRLVQGKKNPSRVNLYLDEEFAFALSIDEVAKNNLKKGMVLSQAEIEHLKEVDEADYSYIKILNFLSFRPRTVKEVRDRLYKYDVKDPTKQNKLIARLQEKGYLDDAKFARWFIESRNTHKPRSLRFIQAELKAKGVDEEIVQTTSKSVADENATISFLLDKKLGPHRKLELAEKQKITSYLVRQGFAWDKIREVVKTWQSE